MNLREIREKKGMTQQQLASMVGMSQSAIGMIETGKRELSIRSLKALAQALKVAPAQLLDA